MVSDIIDCRKDAARRSAADNFSAPKRRRFLWPGLAVVFFGAGFFGVDALQPHAVDGNWADQAIFECAMLQLLGFSIAVIWVMLQFVRWSDSRSGKRSAHSQSSPS